MLSMHRLLHLLGLPLTQTPLALCSKQLLRRQDLWQSSYPLQKLQTRCVGALASRFVYSCGCPALLVLTQTEYFHRVRALSLVLAKGERQRLQRLNQAIQALQLLLEMLWLWCLQMSLLKTLQVPQAQVQVP